MPSSLTHSYFAIDVYNKLDNVCKNKIKNLDYLKIFAQGPDLLYFFSSLTKGNMKIRKLGSYCHKHKTKDFFVNLASAVIFSVTTVADVIFVELKYHPSNV